MSCEYKRARSDFRDEKNLKAMAGEPEITLSKGIDSLQGDHCPYPGPSIPFAVIKQGCMIRRGFPGGVFVPFLGPSRYSSPLSSLHKPSRRFSPMCSPFQVCGSSLKAIKHYANVRASYTMCVPIMVPGAAGGMKESSNVENTQTSIPRANVSRNGNIHHWWYLEWF